MRYSSIATLPFLNYLVSLKNMGELAVFALACIWGMLLWFIIPICGVFGAPFFVYFVKRFIAKKKMIPSFIPFLVLVILLTIGVDFIWRHVFEGTIYHEWDTLLVQYSLFSYQSPLLDKTGSWIAHGWQLWHMYALWFGITLLIYTVSAGICLFLFRKQKNYKIYRKIILVSCIILLMAGSAFAVLYSKLF